MFGILNFGTFILAGILLNLTPGADTIYILGRSISQGKKSGVISALGISSGALLHCIFAALGLSILLAKSATAFSIVKYAGAAYLMYLGIKSLLTKSTAIAEVIKEKETAKNYKKVYISGVLTNLLNPKVALFFLAFLPQFINPDYAKSAIPFLILGLTFVTTGTIWCMILAFFSAKFANKIRENSKVKFWMDKTTGVLFILLGIKLALSKK
ncbi:RhtB (resistance to homoserine/threonine) family protein [Aquimarina sp. EL_43]|uniref:LysE family translocator n=1 Tax=unclassified Aquimarina TaxID=2627091 RepID=UPI0018C99547|nr:MULTISPECIES: LysE family translocator [unclassified Aquimarina]MBG6129382.1 RhtB (resistance to homoserine/threonine) family protein [Aquimarina sp. EL_35]MBG6150447.1 RhtB (resistance to homoserine/threonine) family protein [Aquimarina sp. EL_32]MBG6168245.1 RhtB (resistance to homoserine/threonine) family protein [Aquimarina sp. EL_43]